MIATLLLATLLLAGPDAKISYRKKVMVDPSYKPARTPAQIERATRPPPRVRPRTVERTVVVERRPRRVYRYLPRVSFGLGYSHGRRGGWGWGIGLHWPFWLNR